MTQTTVARAKVKTQAPWRLVHDLRAGRKTHDMRVGDLVLTEAGLHIARGNYGNKSLTLWKVRHAGEIG